MVLLGASGDIDDDDDDDEHSKLQSLIDDQSDTFEEDDSRSWKRSLSKSDIDEGEGSLSDKLNATTTSPKAQAALADLGLFGFGGDTTDLRDDDDEDESKRVRDDSTSRTNTVGLKGGDNKENDTGIGGVKLATQESKQDIDDGRGCGRSLFGRGHGGSKPDGGGLFSNLVGQARGKMIELTTKSAKPSFVDELMLMDEDDKKLPVRNVTLPESHIKKVTVKPMEKDISYGHELSNVSSDEHFGQYYNTEQMNYFDTC